MTYAIEVENLSKSIGNNVILNDITMRVKQGEIYGFLGANGAGKTSLMKTLYRILIPTSGTVALLGEEIKNGNNTAFSHIGSIIETPIFYGDFNARENLELHCGYMGGGYEHIDDTLSSFGLSAAINRPVKNLSLGMKQRLALARAFLTRPDLLILDEPINGLDPQGIIEVRELLLRINQEYQTSIFISSHILDELSKIADTIGVIDNGSMLAEISMNDIKNKGINLETYYLDLLKGVGKNEKYNSVGA
jgi:ABC-2 type transport system ATP-binding protein